MGPARLHKGQAGIGDQGRHGAAQEIGRRHKIGVEDRHIGRIAMLEPEGEIASLESGAVAPVKDFHLHAFRRHCHHVAGECGVAVAVAIVQKLDGEPVFRPLHPGGGFGHSDRQQAFVAVRQLHQHGRQFRVAQVARASFGRWRKTRTQASTASWPDKVQTATRTQQSANCRAREIPCMAKVQAPKTSSSGTAGFFRV